jgi:hypothetical protein
MMSSACGGGSTEPAFRVTGRGSAVAGDALALAVVDRDGAALGSDVAVTWRLPATVSALSPDATDPADPLPVPGAAPTGVFVVNPSRGDVASTIADVLFVLDAGSAGRGSLVVTADLSTGDSVAAEIEVSAAPTGDATRGQSVYGANTATPATARTRTPTARSRSRARTTCSRRPASTTRPTRATSAAIPTGPRRCSRSRRAATPTTARSRCATRCLTG